MHVTSARPHGSDRVGKRQCACCNQGRIFAETVTGDKVRLGDTSLMLEVEKDFTVYGDECKFGGGKVIREGMGQAAGVGDQDCPGRRICPATSRTCARAVSCVR